jgi:hypothetical protein
MYNPAYFRSEYNYVIAESSRLEEYAPFQLNWS